MLNNPQCDRQQQWREAIPPSHRIPRATKAEFYEKYYLVQQPCVLTDLEPSGWHPVHPRG
ncbi:MAG TPA: hypothetical protein DCQ32_01930 [Cyanobacteria bacterium UBA8156]|jgi:hypothetical protein|nr:hypothetical protein [Cyanobacteria bacterium UBA8156]